MYIILFVSKIKVNDTSIAPISLDIIKIFFACCFLIEEKITYNFSSTFALFPLVLVLY